MARLMVSNRILQTILLKQPYAIILSKICRSENGNISQKLSRKPFLSGKTKYKGK